MVYHNDYPQPRHGLGDVLRWKLGLGPREAPPVLPASDGSGLEEPRPAVVGKTCPPGQIRLTWIGHATFLIQHEDRNILTDPVFGDCLPWLPLPNLRRATPPGIRWEDLPRIHDVLISHCHYDHLDASSVRKLAARDAPRFWVPAGLHRWFSRRGLQPCAELDWRQSGPLSERIRLECVPAQHFAARGIFDRNRTHWCGWVLRSEARSLYFAGDTAYCPLFRELGERFGGFDLALIPIGAYRPRWLMQPVHVDPDEAVQIHREVRSRLTVACHWGTFALTDEPLDEPPRLLQVALSRQNVPKGQFLVLRPGEVIVA
jgi:N-acyl-phosphatidylethanolamine-hydrolysing phospholipase D